MSVAEFTLGGSWHWKSLEQRFESHPYRVPHRQQAHVRRVLEEQQRRQAECERNAAPGSPTFPDEHQQWCHENADALERILDRAGIPPPKPIPPLTYEFAPATREIHTQVRGRAFGWRSRRSKPSSWLGRCRSGSHIDDSRLAWTTAQYRDVTYRS